MPDSDQGAVDKAGVLSVLDTELVRTQLRRNVGAAVAARAVTILASLIVVPLTVGVLTEAEYGVFSALVSVSIILSLADLGIANSLLTRLSIAQATGQEDEFRSDLSSALAMTLVGSLTVLASFIAMVIASGPQFLFGEAGNRPLPPGTAAATFIVAAVALLRIPLSVVQIARRAQLHGRHNALFDLLSSALRLGMVLLASELGANLVAVVIAAFAPLLLVDLINLFAYRFAFPNRSPNLRSASRARTRDLAKPAVLFLLLQVTTAFSYSSGSLIVARTLGVEAVQQYSIPNQIALAGISVLTAATGQLWPAISQALTSGHLQWARSLVLRSTIIVAVTSSAIAVIFATLGSWFLIHWSNGEVQPSGSIMAGLALWIVLGSLAGLVSFILNAMQLIALQVALSLPATIITVALGTWLTSRVGVAGVVWATVLAATVIVLLPSTAIAMMRLRRATC